MLAKNKEIKETEERYWEGLGRRKTSLARVRISEGKGIIVNDKPFERYFPVPEMINLIEAPLRELKLLSRFKVSAVCHGGGLNGQAEAVRLGLSRAMGEYDSELKQPLRQLGFLTRDSRMKERKKPGLKRARKAPRWSKR